MKFWIALVAVAVCLGIYFVSIKGRVPEKKEDHAPKQTSILGAEKAKNPWNSDVEKVRKSLKEHSQQLGKKQAMTGFIDEWFSKIDDPKQISNWLREYKGNQQELEIAYDAFAIRWIEFDPEASTEWIKSLPEGQTRSKIVDRAIARLCRLKEGGCQKALEIFRLKNYPEREHQRKLTSLFWKWHMHSPTEATEALQNADWISAPLRARIEDGFAALGKVGR